MVQIKELHNRRSLSEGINNGMCFAFLNENYETFNAHTACRDFLNDIVFTENTGIPLTIYGLTTKKQNIYGKEQSLMGIKFMKNSSGTGYSYSESIDADIKSLKENYQHMANALTEIGMLFNLTGIVTIEEAEDNYFVVRFPNEWCISSHSISLFTLFLRVLFMYKGDIPYIDFLKEFSYNQYDAGMLKKILAKWDTIIAKGMPQQCAYIEENAKLNRWAPHSCGIMNYLHTI